MKLALRWIREHIADYGGDPGFVVITGGSAGGHLAALAAFTANDPEYQPGFEDVDTSVAACVPFYGVYDLTGRFGGRGADGMSGLTERLVLRKQLVDDARRSSERRRSTGCMPARRRSWSSTAPTTRSSRGRGSGVRRARCAPCRRAHGLSRAARRPARLRGLPHGAQRPRGQGVHRFLGFVHRSRAAAGPDDPGAAPRAIAES